MIHDIEKRLERCLEKARLAHNLAKPMTQQAGILKDLDDQLESIYFEIQETITTQEAGND